MILTIQTHVTL